jgi:uncharacterized protein (DUF924 family)
MDPRIDEVITFWFGTEIVPPAAVTGRWFRKDPAFDDEIRTRFGALAAEAASGGGAATGGAAPRPTGEAGGAPTPRRLATLGDAWRGSARGELALLVLLDQFPRNLYRGDPRAFAQDARALAIARDLRGSGRARELTLTQRMIALLPFEHAEDLAAQAEAMAGFAELVAEAREREPASLELMEVALDFARRHQVIIERFGRFPHRNAVLGRASTPEERAFLEQPGSSF